MLRVPRSLWRESTRRSHCHPIPSGAANQGGRRRDPSAPAAPSLHAVNDADIPNLTGNGDAANRLQARMRGLGAPGMALSMIMLLYVAGRIGYDAAGAVGAAVPLVTFFAIEACL